MKIDAAEKIRRIAHIPAESLMQPRGFGIAGPAWVPRIRAPFAAGKKGQEPMARFRAFNALDSFITAALTIMVPLSLASRGISLVEIAGIVALVPFVFTVSRLLFASVADGIGTRPFFVFNAAANTAASLLYMNAQSATSYVSGRFLEGLRGGAIWSVNRLEARDLTSERKVENEYAKLSAIRVLMFAIGTFAAGFVAHKLGFEGGFAVLAGISLISLLLSFAIGSGSLKNEPLHLILSRLDFRKKSRELWKYAAVLTVGMPASSLPLNLLLPLYLNSIGMGYEEIGLALALYYFVAAAVVPVALRFEKSVRAIAVYAGVVYFAGTALLPFMSDIVQVPILIMALGDGLGSITWEGVLAKGVRGSRNQATDIGYLHVPAHIATTIMLALSGGIAQFFGFGAAFFMCGILMLAYGLLSSRVLD